MKHFESIVIGGGPAGSTCAGALIKAGREVVILDKVVFPRPKLCAGWISEKLMADLAFTADEYPHSILKLKVKSHFKYLPFALPGTPTPGANYSIRRVEFDYWLLKRSKAKFIEHSVKNIHQDGGRYIIDEKFSCDYLIGAGGTMCPVRRSMFPNNRRKFRQVVTLEKEFKYPSRSDICHLYFLKYGTKAYGWYVPKGDGFVNIGIGGKANYFKKSEQNIHQYFGMLLADLVKAGLLHQSVTKNFGAKGHPYYLNSRHGEIKKGNCFLIGDAAGFATVDMGEGLGPAIESGLMVADEILGIGVYSKQALTHYTTNGIVQKIAHRFGGQNFDGVNN